MTEPYHLNMADPAPSASEADAAAQTLAEILSQAKVSPPDAADLLVAVRASIVGGDAACAYYGESLEITDKGHNDPVTAADYASNRTILDLLLAERAEDPVLSEESPPPADGGKIGRLWVVDPLDGTKEFIAGNGEFSIMVGLAVDGRARLGAVSQPAISRVFAGIVGEGAWTLSGPVGGWSVSSLSADSGDAHEGPIRFVRSRSHPDERLRQLASELGEIEEVVSGSVGIKCALVARGSADLYVHPVPYLKEWDTCAPEAVLRGAGGLVTDCAGEPLEYGDTDPRQLGGIFAGTPAAWDRARPLVVDVTRALFDERG